MANRGAKKRRADACATARFRLVQVSTAGEGEPGKAKHRQIDWSAHLQDARPRETLATKRRYRCTQLNQTAKEVQRDNKRHCQIPNAIHERHHDDAQRCLGRRLGHRVRLKATVVFCKANNLGNVIQRQDHPGSHVNSSDDSHQTPPDFLKKKDCGADEKAVARRTELGSISRDFIGVFIDQRDGRWGWLTIPTDMENTRTYDCCIRLRKVSHNNY